MRGYDMVNSLLKKPSTWPGVYNNNNNNNNNSLVAPRFSVVLKTNKCQTTRLKVRLALAPPQRLLC